MKRSQRLASSGAVRPTVDTGIGQRYSATAARLAARRCASGAADFGKPNERAHRARAFAEPADAGRAWAAPGALLAAGTLAVGWLGGHAATPSALAHHLDWQPTRALSEPWRAISAVFVHYSGLHLAANLAGLVLTTALGLAAGLPRRAALAWLLAWPLAQLGLLLQPALAHYGGLSGVLHAGVAVAATQLLLTGRPAQRRLGAAITGVLALKIGLEAPWAATLTHPAGWDIAVAPGAHLSGVCAGALASLAAHAGHLRSTAVERHGPAIDA